MTKYSYVYKDDHLNLMTHKIIFDPYMSWSSQIACVQDISLFLSMIDQTGMININDHLL